MTMKIFFKEFYVVKILERGAFKVWNEVNIGEEVYLELEKGKTVLVKCQDGQVFGELPENESKIIRDLLIQEWTNIFKAFVCRKDAEVPQYDQHVSIAVYIENAKDG